MVDQFIAVCLGNSTLQFFYFRIHKFHDLTGFDADHVIVMLALINLEYRPATFEVVPLDQARNLELRENPVYRRKTDELTRLDEMTVDVFGRQMMLRALLQQMQYLQSRPSRLEAGLSEPTVLQNNLPC